MLETWVFHTPQTWLFMYKEEAVYSYVVYTYNVEATDMKDIQETKVEPKTKNKIAYLKCMLNEKIINISHDSRHFRFISLISASESPHMTFKM